VLNNLSVNLRQTIAQKTDSRMVVLRHATLPSDFTLLINHGERPIEQRGSQEGKQLAMILEEYGRVYHSVWIEEYVIVNLERRNS